MVEKLLQASTGGNDICEQLFPVGCIPSSALCDTADKTEW